VSRAEQRQVVDRFVAALSTGDVQGLLDVLAPDVVLVSDGGGLAGVARKPIAGASRLARFLTSAGARDVRGSVVWLNGSPGFLLLMEGQVVAAVGVTVESGRITRLFAVANPGKLERVGSEAELTRVPEGGRP
jgi:RNA polymerase sigma-70 factor (ECF subfamily)